MKTTEQIVSFIEGWMHAITTDNDELDANNRVLMALRELHAYIVMDNIFDESLRA